MYVALNTFFYLISFIFYHPLNRTNRFGALLRFLRWQIGSRLLSGAVAVPFVDNTRLLVLPGMTGATGNIYCGLHEFEDMGLVLHALRPGDLFVDVGANIGSYTVLAAGACGAHVIAVEPIPFTFAHLMDNVRLNNLQDLVQAQNVGLGAVPGMLPFSTDLDTINHVLSIAETADIPSLQVPVDTLDSLVAGDTPLLIKIDTEGYETEVIAGAERILSYPTTMAVLMELNGSGRRYGFDEEKLHRSMLKHDFRPFRYDPLTRVLTPLETKNLLSPNTLYVSNIELLTARVQSAPRHQVHGASI
jgi:FkbM family methyltransferase